MEQNHIEVTGMFAYHFSHYLFSDNSEWKMKPSDGSSVICAKWVWRAQGSSQQTYLCPLDHLHSSYYLTTLLLLAVERLSNACLWTLNNVSRQDSVLLGTHWGNAAEKAHKGLWYHFSYYYIPKSVLVFMSIGMVSFIFGHSSICTVILFCSQNQASIFSGFVWLGWGEEIPVIRVNWTATKVSIH